MTMNIQTRQPEKTDLPPLEARKNYDVNKVLRGMLHRRALEFHQRLRQVKAKLQNNRQRLVFDYIFNNTIGFNKLSDQIALSQFEQGKCNHETGEVIDNGCGLSHNPIRQARKELIQMGLILEEQVSDERGASSANRYTLRFVIEMVKAEIAHKKMKPLKRDTPGEYQQQVDTIKLPSEVIKQRCINPKIKKKTVTKKHYLHREHVDYLVDEIEKATGDKHSRGGFAQIALTVPEGTVIELLHTLRDRGNIKNKGAWFISSASRYAKRQIIKADEPQPDKTTSTFSRDWQRTRSQLAKNLSMGEVFSEQKPLPIYQQKRLLEQMRL